MAFFKDNICTTTLENVPSYATTALSCSTPLISGRLYTRMRSNTNRLRRLVDRNYQTAEHVNWADHLHCSIHSCYTHNYCYQTLIKANY